MKWNEVETKYKGRIFACKYNQTFKNLRLLSCTAIMLNSIDIISSKRGSCFLWINNILSKTWDSTLASTSIEVIILLIKTQQNCTVINKYFVILKESFHNYLNICVYIIYIQIHILYNARVCFPLWSMTCFLYHQKILCFFCCLYKTFLYWILSCFEHFFVLCFEIKQTTFD